MAGVGAWLVSNAATVSAVASVATTAYTASEAHQARKGARGVTSATVLARQIAEDRRKKAQRVQEGILANRARERRGGGFGRTIAAGGARALGTSNTGGKSLLG